MAGEVRTLTVGSDVSVLDIYLSSGGNPVAATFVGFELKDATSVVAASGTATNPATGTYKASGVVPAGYQLGTWEIQWNIITAGNELVHATEQFCVNAVDIAIGFVPSTDKTSSIYDAVRLDVGDPEGQVFDDGYQQRILVKAVRRLNHRLGLSPTARPQGIPGGFGGPRIKVSPIVADLVAGTITPDNDELCDLVIMMMEFIIVTAEVSALKRLNANATSGPHVATVSNASQDGVTVKNADGVEVSIAGGRLQNRYLLHKLDVQTKEKELEAAIKAFLGRQTGNYGKMIY
jgi:hypothetical protein